MITAINIIIKILKKKFRYAREIKLRNNNKKRKGEKTVKTENLPVPFRLKYTAHSGRIKKKEDA